MLVPREVDTNKACYVPLEVTLNPGRSALNHCYLPNYCGVTTPASTVESVLIDLLQALIR